MAHLRLGRSGDTGGSDSPERAGEEQRAVAWPTGAREPAELPTQFPPHQGPHPGSVGPGIIGGRPGRSGVAVGRGPPGGVGEEWRAIAMPTWAWVAC